MEENVFIIHPSEIIRKGLAWILQEYFNLEITQLGSVHDLSSFLAISNNLIIVIHETGQKIPGEVEEKLRKHNQVFLVGFTGKNSKPDLPYEYELNELSSALQIQKLIQVIRKSASKQKTSPVENGDLTIREKDVIRHIALGFFNKEIADRLNISIHTVISHRKNITEKLNIKSISGLTMYAIMNNLIDMTDINPEELI
ncbi:response regulator transcription factor [Gaoshiqia sp. Z1-71]|uniref:response regulator transcription factor n=1 Tax=Gaoshiqia hydrogeniformans TaxID=3290090 RepID=UPI003BF79464